MSTIVVAIYRDDELAVRAYPGMSAHAAVSQLITENIDEEDDFDVSDYEDADSMCDAFDDADLGKIEYISVG